MVKISADELLTIEYEPIKYIVQDIIPEGGLVYVCGSSGSFKTFFLIYTALSCLKGSKILNEFETKKCRVLYIDEENRERRMKERILHLSNGLNMDLEELCDFKLWICENFKLGDPENLEQVKKEIEDFNPELIIVDSISKVFRGEENNVNHVKLIYDWIKPTIIKNEVTWVFIHHTRKKSGTTKKDDMAGSREFSAMADCVLTLDKTGRNEFMLKQVKNRDDKDISAVKFLVNTSYSEGKKTAVNLVNLGKVKEECKDNALMCVDAIEKWIKDSNINNFEVNTLKKHLEPLGWKNNNIFNALKMMITMNKIKKIKRGVYEKNT